MSDRKLNVDITGDSRNLKSALGSATKDLKVFGVGVDQLSGKMGMLAGAAAVGAVVKGLWDLAKSTAENADRLLDLQSQTGITTDKLQEYEHVARIAGVNSEVMANSVFGLTQRLARGTMETGPLARAFTELGISMTDASGKMRNGGDVTEEVIQQLASMEDVTKRNVLGAQIFTGAWKDLAPVLDLGAKGIEKAKNEAHKLGLVMGRDSLLKANDFRIELENMQAQLKMTGQEVAVGVIPVFQHFVEEVSKLIHALRNVKNGLADIFPPGIINAFEKGGKALLFAANWPAQLLKVAGNYFQKRKDTSETEAEIAQRIWEQKTAMEAAKDQAKDLHIEELKRLSALGDIGRLELEIKETEAKFIAANSDADRIRHQTKMNELNLELEKIKEIAEQGAIDKYMKGRNMPTEASPMPMLGASPDLMAGYVDKLKEVGQATIEARTENEKLSESFEHLEGVAYEAGAAMGDALGRMVTEGKDATGEIIRQMLAQVVAALIKHMTISMGPAGALLAGAAPGLAKAMFANIPGYSSGVQGHPGGFAWVGERGPELMELPQGANVYPHRESMAMAGGAGGGTYEFIIKGENLYGVLKKELNRRKYN